MGGHGALIAFLKNPGLYKVGVWKYILFELGRFARLCKLDAIHDFCELSVVISHGAVL